MTSKYDQPILDFMKENRWYTSRDIAIALGLDVTSSRKRNLTKKLETLTKFGFLERKQMWDEELGRKLYFYRKL